MVFDAKARSRFVGVVVNADAGLSTIDGFGGELNQVWAHLVDIAIDAVAESGRVEVTATYDGRRIEVCVADDAPYVPAETLDRVIDPAFTTRLAGSRTALGLDSSRRLIRRHNGVISLESTPGRTTFSVSLPIVATEHQPA